MTFTWRVGIANNEHLNLEETFLSEILQKFYASVFNLVGTWLHWQCFSAVMHFVSGWQITTFCGRTYWEKNVKEWNIMWSNVDGGMSDFDAIILWMSEMDVRCPLRTISARYMRIISRKMATGHALILMSAERDHRFWWYCCWRH